MARLTYSLRFQPLAKSLAALTRRMASYLQVTLAFLMNFLAELGCKFDLEIRIHPSFQAL
jgi:hypothetical protein